MNIDLWSAEGIMYLQIYTSSVHLVDQFDWVNLKNDFLRIAIIILLFLFFFGIYPMPKLPICFAQNNIPKAVKKILKLIIFVN